LNLLIVPRAPSGHVLLKSFRRTVKFFVDGATKQTSERIRVGAKPERLVADIEAVNRAQRRIKSQLPRLSFNVVLKRSNSRRRGAEDSIPV
jgi:hypothetical protein